jgi:hypothetical protein
VMALNASSPWSRTATKVRSEPTVTDLAFISYSRARLGSSVRLRPLNFIALNDVVPAKPVNSHRSESCRWCLLRFHSGHNRPRARRGGARFGYDHATTANNTVARLRSA